MTLHNVLEPGCIYSLNHVFVGLSVSYKVESRKVSGMIFRIINRYKGLFAHNNVMEQLQVTVESVDSFQRTLGF